MDSIIRWVYGISGIINVFMYIPQIGKVWKIPQGISFVTWWFWLGASIVGFLYAIPIAKNRNDAGDSRQGHWMQCYFADCDYKKTQG